MVRTERPEVFCSPSIVKVFPLPVVPYAKTQELKPEQTGRTRVAEVFKYTSSVVAEPGNK